MDHYELTGHMIRARYKVDRYLRKKAPHVPWSRDHMQLVGDDVLNFADSMVAKANERNLGPIQSLIAALAGTVMDIVFEETAKKYITHEYIFCVHCDSPNIIHYSKPNLRELDREVSAGNCSYEQYFGHEAVHCRILSEQRRRGIKQDSQWAEISHEGFAEYVATDLFGTELPYQIDAAYLIHYFEQMKDPKEKERSLAYMKETMKSIDPSFFVYTAGNALCYILENAEELQSIGNLIDLVIDPNDMPSPEELVKMLN